MPITFNPDEPFIEEAAPRFDPNQPFSEEAAPRFDPSKPFTEESGGAGAFGVDESQLTSIPEGAKLSGTRTAAAISPQDIVHAVSMSPVGDAAREAGHAIATVAAPLSTPLYNPQPSAEDIAFRKKHPVIGGIEAGVVDLAKAFTSPIGIATLGIGALPVEAQKVISLTFAAQMASQTPEIAKELGAEFALPPERRDIQKITKLLTVAAGTAGFTALAAKHGLTPSPTLIEAGAPQTAIALEEITQPIKTPVEIIRSEIPATDEALLKERTQNASRITSTAEMGVRSQGGEMVKGPPLLQQGETPSKEISIQEVQPVQKENLGVAEDVTASDLSKLSPSEFTDWVNGKDQLSEQNRIAATETKETLQGLADKAKSEAVELQKGLDVNDPKALDKFSAATSKMQFFNEAVRQKTAEAIQPLTETNPEMVGMGAAKSGEVSVSGNPDITGIAQRVREQAAAAGQERLAPTGEGISAEDSIINGEAILHNDPQAAQKAMTTFESDPNKSVSAEGMAASRAELRQLAYKARRIEERYGTNSPEWKAAFEKRSAWAERLKKMQTEWHKSGMAQQGEQDIDTGSFTGMASAYRDSTGKDFTPVQAEKAKRISNKVKTAEDVSTEVAGRLMHALDAASKTVREASITAAKSDVKNRVNPEIKVWEKVKEYLDKGDDSFDDVRSKIATDLGMPLSKVTELLTKTRRLKHLADEAWRKQQALRQFRNQAQRWLSQASIPGYQRALASVPRILFGLKVGFHGTVALGTHAPMVGFQPRFWSIYVRDFGKMYKMVGSPAYYEMQVQELLRRPNYITARRAGLVNDPFMYEDYNSPDTAKYFGNLTGMGNRGYSVLKIIRQDMFDQHWGNLPKTAQIPEIAKAIADAVNHATGVVKVNAPKGVNLALFAPRLEMSRVAWLAVDPAKAVDTFSRWKTANEGEKYFAINQVKEKAWTAGTLLGLLALNQGFLTAVGSDQKVNFDDPFHSDWLKFKVAGMTFSYGNAMLTMARLPVRLYKIRESDGGKLKNLVYPDEDTYSVLGEYARSQESPFASLATTLWLKGDWQNRPLPSSDRPVPKRLRAQGIQPYTWTEFWAEQMAPIPVEEAMREVWKHGLGMSDEQIASTRKAMATIAIMGATGARLTEDVPYKTESKK